MDKDKFKFFINKLLEKVDKKNKKRTLVDCIYNSGFIKENEPEEEYVSFESKYEPNQYNINEIEIRPGVKEYEHQSFLGRTMIQGNERLNRIQNYIISNEETEFQKINDFFENTLNVLKIDNVTVKKDALNMYTIIKEKSKILKFPEPKASLKQGYLIMCLYYSLIKVICINVINIQLVSGFINADLQLADYYIKKIFEDTPFENSQQEQCLCEMKPFLLEQFNKNVIDDIYNIIKELQKKELFRKPAQKVEIAAAIYYTVVKNKKIRMKNNKFLTYKDITRFCSVSDDTINKTVNLILSNT